MIIKIKKKNLSTETILTCKSQPSSHQEWHPCEAAEYQALTLRLRSEDTEIRFKGMATYEHGPEFRKALSSVERLDWHGEPISSLPGLF